MTLRQTMEQPLSFLAQKCESQVPPQDQPEQPTSVVMSTGSVVCFLGRSGMAAAPTRARHLRRLAVSAQYCELFVRYQEITSCVSTSTRLCFCDRALSQPSISRGPEHSSAFHRPVDGRHPLKCQWLEQRLSRTV
jgi:hypothetical protein